jgi:hypothetical protein
LDDRAMIEFSAKAMGLHIDKSSTNGGGHNNDGFDLAGNAMLNCHENITWNPLSNGNDTLRMAAQLKIEWVVLNGAWTAIHQPSDGVGIHVHVDERDCKGCPLTTMKRAITGVGALIGKMKKTKGQPIFKTQRKI